MSVFSSIPALALSAGCTAGAVAVSCVHIASHLKNYSEPTFQRYIVRIIFMVPVYASMSFCALLFSDYAMYFNTIRDVYEAWVIYNFLSLCLAWVGGPGAVVTSLSGRMLKPSYLLCTCCLPPIPLDGRFIRRCKQGCLQFVFLKPALATACLLLYSQGLYIDGNFSFADGYLYITAIYMLSYSIAIYALILFYVACKHLLRSFNPIPKFLMIKAVVFLTYWQGVLLFIVAQMGWIKSEADAADLQNVLICIEMALAAGGFVHAFPVRPFAQGNIGEGAELSDSIKHAITLTDVVSDTVHQFAATYHDYVLYSDGTQEAPRHYRTRTFVPHGKEMEDLRKLKSKHSFTSTISSSSSAPSSATSSIVIPFATPGASGSIQPPPPEALFQWQEPAAEESSSSKLGMLSEANEQQNVAYDFSPFSSQQAGVTVAPTLTAAGGGRGGGAAAVASDATKGPASVVSRESGVSEGRSSAEGDAVTERSRLTHGARGRKSDGLLADEEGDEDDEGFIMR